MTLLLGAALLAVSAACGPGSAGADVDPPTRRGAPTVETDAAEDAGDAAIWVDPADPARSVVIGTDKERGLAVYGLDGRQVSFSPGGTPNNVDLRDGFPLGGRPEVLVVAGDDTASAFLVFRLDTAERRLVEAAGGPVKVGVRAHGSCLYRSRTSGRLYAFAAAQDGQVEQWELSGGDDGKVSARRVRGPWDVGGRVDGCVADDALGRLYLAEEDVGVWRYGAEPSDPTSSRHLVDGTEGRHLAADVEGLGIVETQDSPPEGLLVVSSQGDSSFVVYRRQGDNAFVEKVAVEDGPGVDGCDDTDGLEVTGRSLGPAFPRGALVCQDADNPGGTSNFKLVPLERLVP